MANEFFIPAQENIDKLLTGRFYKIADYQRPYSWQSEEILTFLDDIYTRYDDNTRIPYFMGSIIVSKGNDDLYEVVDGQQRLTTFIILAKVVSEYYGNLLVVNKGGIVRNITKDAISKYVQADGMERATRMHPQELADFEISVIKANKDKFNSILEYFAQKKNQKDIKRELEKESNSKIKYENAVNTIITKLDDLFPKNNEQQPLSFQNFINYIFNDIYLILIETQNVNTAIELFKVINDRGLDLEASDIIKANILYHTKESLRSDLNKEWNDLKKICDDKVISMTDMLILYQYYFYSSNPKTSVTKSFEDDILGKCYKESGWNLILDIKEFVSLLPDTQNNIDQYTLSMNYLLGGMGRYWRCILAAARKHNFKQYDELAKLLCSYYYVHWILGGDGNTIKQQSFKLIEYVGGMKFGTKDTPIRKNINEIKEELVANICKEYSHDYINMVQLNLTDSNLYSKKWLKPLLMLVNYAMSDSGNITFIKLEGNHIEHIIPQSGNDRQSYYPAIDFMEFDAKYLNSLGNLTLLEDTLNIKASNKANEHKLYIYQGRGGTEGMTTFAITTRLSEICKDNKGFDVEALQKRCSEISNKVISLLTI